MAQRAGDAGSISGSGRSPGVGNGNPVQYSYLENSLVRGAWWGPWGYKQSDTLSNWPQIKRLFIFIRWFCLSTTKSSPRAIPYYPNQHFYTQVCLGRQKMLSTLPQTFQVSLNYCICTYELGLQKTLRYTLFPTYHTVVRKRVSWSRLWYGTLLRVTEHQRLGKRRSLRGIQIRWIILHGRWCLSQQNSKVNSRGERKFDE